MPIESAAPAPPPAPPPAFCPLRTSSHVGPRSAAAAAAAVFLLLLLPLLVLLPLLLFSLFLPAAITLVSDACRAIAPGTAAATSRFCPTSHCLVVAVGVGGALGAGTRGR